MAGLITHNDTMDELKQLKQADYTFGVTKHEDVRKVLNENASATNDNNATIVAELNKKADAATVTAELDKKADAATVTAELGKKVDKVPGKGLSTNDYTNDDRDAVDSLPFVGEFDDLAALRSSIMLGVTRSAFLCKVGGITLLVRYTGATGNTGTGTYYFMSAPKVVTYLTWVGQTGKPTTYTQWATADLGGGGLPAGVVIEGGNSKPVYIFGPVSIGTPADTYSQIIGTSGVTIAGEVAMAGKVIIGNVENTGILEENTVFLSTGVIIGCETGVAGTPKVLMGTDINIVGRVYIGTGVGIGEFAYVGDSVNIGSSVYIANVEGMGPEEIRQKSTVIGTSVIIGTARNTLGIDDMRGKTIITDLVFIGMDDAVSPNADNPGVHIMTDVLIGSHLHIASEQGGVRLTNSLQNKSILIPWDN